MSRLDFIDLFCGCGGFSLGMQRAGLSGVAAIDSNTEAVATFQENLPQIPFVLQKKLEEFPPEELASLIKTDRMDVIIGGPPCQGFSKARMRDGANHGSKHFVDDPRRHLYQQFL
ncbi:MAG: DNA cytosine methyltransferase [Verrucomicrobiota bacterium]